VADLKKVSQNTCLLTEKKYSKFRTRYTVSGPRFEAETPRINTKILRSSYTTVVDATVGATAADGKVVERYLSNYNTERSSLNFLWVKQTTNKERGEKVNCLIRCSKHSINNAVTLLFFGSKSRERGLGGSEFLI
jgi:hypothetical protein